MPSNPTTSAVPPPLQESGGSLRRSVRHKSGGTAIDMEAAARGADDAGDDGDRARAGGSKRKESAPIGGAPAARQLRPRLDSLKKTVQRGLGAAAEGQAAAAAKAGKKASGSKRGRDAPIREREVRAHEYCRCHQSRHSTAAAITTCTPDQLSCLAGFCLLSVW
jgi:hypothetical protein